MKRYRRFPHVVVFFSLISFHISHAGFVRHSEKENGIMPLQTLP